MSQSLWTAYQWIHQLLNAHEIPFQIVGGFAVSLYGGSRPVADIDLYVPKSQAELLASLVAPYVSKPLKHYVEAGWDLEYLQLIYENQKIEIGLTPGTKILNNAVNEWVDLHVDFDQSVMVQANGFDIPLMPKEHLIQYKSLLNREVDVIDIHDLKNAAG